MIQNTSISSFTDEDDEDTGTGDLRARLGEFVDCRKVDSESLHRRCRRLQFLCM
jgi:hypothetical protein